MAQTDAENAGTNRPTQGRRNRQGTRAKVARENPSNARDVKNEDCSGDVYENKGPDDNLPDTKDDISAWLNAILHRNSRILRKPSALFHFLSAGERTPGFEMKKLEMPNAVLPPQTIRLYPPANGKSRKTAHEPGMFLKIQQVSEEKQG